MPASNSAGSLTANSTITVDAKSPTVVSVSAVSADGVYKSGDTIRVKVTFTEDMTVTGTPTLQLAAGGTGSGLATVMQINGSDVLFDYLVGSDDAVTNLNYTSASALSAAGGIISDSAGNQADLSLPNPGDPGSLKANSDINIDASPPAIRRVETEATTGLYKLGDQIAIHIIFDENVNVSGIPTLSLNADANTATAVYISG